MFSSLIFAFKAALRRPRFTFSVCCILGIGVAAVTTMFSFVNAILLNPLPFPKSDELVQICTHDLKDNQTWVSVSVPDVIDWKQQTAAFEDMAYYRAQAFALTGLGDPEWVECIRISDGFLSALLVRPCVGRWFTKDEDNAGAGRVCILSYQLWVQRFNADPNVLDKALGLNGKTTTIVGVMPASFTFPDGAEIAVPFAATKWEKTSRDDRVYRAIGRLKPGVQLLTAQTELNVIAKQLEEHYPNSNANSGIQVVQLKEEIVGKTGKVLKVLFGAVCCVLAIACANVASLLTVRTVGRKKEFAIRIALGATRLQIAGQLLIESLVLAAIGGILSLLISVWCVKVLVALSPALIPRLGEVRVDSVVLLFCLAICLASGVAFGLLPIIQTLKTNVTENLNEEGKGGAGLHRTSWMRGAILLFEVALTIVLMIVAGLFIRSYSRMQRVDLGFDPKQIVISKLVLPVDKYPVDRDRTRLLKPLLSRLEQLPGLKSVAFVNWPPIGVGNAVTFGLEGVLRPAGEEFTARQNCISEHYFKTVGMRILAGRNFKSTDTETSPRVIIINHSLGNKYFDSENPIGKRITVEGQRTNLFTIVGVVNDVHQKSVTLESSPELYFDYLQVNDLTMHIVAKTEDSTDLSALISSIKKELRSLDSNLAVGNVERFDWILARSVQVQRFRTYLLASFAGIGLILSAVGIFAFVSYTVGQRTREIGILVALGAPRKYIVRTVMRETVLVIALAVAIGLSLGFMASRLVAGFLFQVEPTDAFTFLSVAIFVGTVAGIAAYFPTRKAARLEVITALRS